MLPLPADSLDMVKNHTHTHTFYMESSEFLTFDDTNNNVKYECMDLPN